jgi:hypothetical protein
MSLLDDEARVRELLAPLNRVEPVTLRQESRSRRPVLIVGLIAAALLATGVAIAAGFDPFTGIRTAHHHQRPQDILAPSILAHLNASNARAGALSSGSLVPASTRLLGQLASGRRIYVAGTSKGRLAILVTDHGRLEVASYGAPLTQSEPVTITSFVRVKNGPHATPPLSYGIAKDGITAVSFTAHGREQTVPVKNNVWFYEGNSNVLASITIHYANGSTRTLTH